VFLWRDTHRLDPFRPLPGQPIEIRAVALDWTWVFIYPAPGRTANLIMKTGSARYGVTISIARAAGRLAPPGCDWFSR
jgi:heme/copper-type cytochrome/quinol oxidase subunit 2